MKEPLPPGSAQPTCGAEVGAEGVVLPSPVGVTARMSWALDVLRNGYREVLPMFLCFSSISLP